MASIKKWIQDKGKTIPPIKRKQDLFFENGIDFFDKTLPLTSIVLIAISISFICGLIAIGFRYLIFGFTRFFLTEKPVEIPVLGNYFYIILPAIGGLLVGILVYFFAREAKGHGIPEVMASIAINDGKMRARIIGVKALASALTIGSGGSAGREGPIVQMGAAVGSSIAQKLKITPYQTKILVACGAAAGISATFNTPIAAVVFTLELLLREFKTRSFIPIVISSVIGSVVSRELLFLLGETEKFVFTVPAYSLVTPWELVFYLLLGLICGGVAIVFTRSIYGFEDLFEKIKIPEYYKPAFGGLAVGCIGFILLSYTGRFYIFGVGYDTMSSVFNGGLAVFGVIVILIFLKILATSLSLGSGGSGGIFVPALFIGSMTGGAFGLAVQGLFPDITAGFEAYAIVGMAALFAGCSRAALTSILIVFEMTGNYDIIIPLMFACVISDAVGMYGLNKESIYTIKLRRKGVIIDHDMNVDIMKTHTVERIMNKNVQTIKKDVKITKIYSMIKSKGYIYYPVVDEWGSLIGVVTRTDVKDAMIADKKTLLVQDIMSRNIITVTIDDTLDVVIQKMIRNSLSRLPVVDGKDSGKIVGVITKGDILRFYAHEK